MIFAVVEDVDDMGVLDLGGKSGFIKEAVAGFLLFVEIGVDHFDHDLPRKAALLGLGEPEVGHPGTFEALFDQVATTSQGGSGLHGAVSFELAHRAHEFDEFGGRLKAHEKRRREDLSLRVKEANPREAREFVFFPQSFAFRRTFTVLELDHHKAAAFGDSGGVVEAFAFELKAGGTPVGPEVDDRRALEFFGTGDPLGFVGDPERFVFGIAGGRKASLGRGGRRRSIGQ